MPSRYVVGPHWMLFSDATFPMYADLLLWIQTPGSDEGKQCISIHLDEAFGRSGKTVPVTDLDARVVQFLQKEYTFSSNAHTRNKRERRPRTSDQLYQLEELVIRCTSVPVTISISSSDESNAAPSETRLSVHVTYFTNRYPLHHTIVIIGLDVTIDA